jgi:hypothetical protein
MLKGQKTIGENEVKGVQDGERYTLVKRIQDDLQTMVVHVLFLDYYEIEVILIQISPSYPSRLMVGPPLNIRWATS